MNGCTYCRGACWRCMPAMFPRACHGCGAVYRNQCSCKVDEPAAPQRSPEQAPNVPTKFAQSSPAPPAPPPPTKPAPKPARKAHKPQRRREKPLWQSGNTPPPRAEALPILLEPRPQALPIVLAPPPPAPVDTKEDLRRAAAALAAQMREAEIDEFWDANPSMTRREAERAVRRRQKAMAS